MSINPGEERGSQTVELLGLLPLLGLCLGLVWQAALASYALTTAAALAPAAARAAALGADPRSVIAAMSGGLQAEVTAWWQGNGLSTVEVQVTVPLADIPLLGDPLPGPRIRMRAAYPLERPHVPR